MWVHCCHACTEDHFTSNYSTGHDDECANAYNGRSIHYGGGGGWTVHVGSTFCHDRIKSGCRRHGRSAADLHEHQRCIVHVEGLPGGVGGHRQRRATRTACDQRVARDIPACLSGTGADDSGNVHLCQPQHRLHKPDLGVGTTGVSPKSDCCAVRRNHRGRAVSGSKCQLQDLPHRSTVRLVMRQIRF